VYTLESTTENIRDVYENRAPVHMGKTEKCMGWISIGVCKLTSGANLTSGGKLPNLAAGPRELANNNNCCAN